MLLSNSFKPDPRVLKEAVHLQKNGFSVTIVCWDRRAELPAEEILPTGVKVLRVQNVPSEYGIGIHQLLRIPKFWSAALQYIKTLDPQLLHCHDFDTLPAGLWYGFVHHIPVIYDAHEYYAELVKPRLRGIFGWFLFFLIKLAEMLGAHYSRAVITVDEALANKFHKHNKHVIILGHYPEKSMAQTRNPVFTRQNITLIYAGRLSVDRGILLYVDLLKQLIEKGIPCHLLLVGVFTPESEKLIFDDYAKIIINFISYLGWIPYDRMPQIYHQADISLAVLLPEPRYVAATPVKLFEYMASGLPVIASNFPAIETIIRDANCGLLVDPLASINNAAIVIDHWWQNHTIPQALGENGQQAILSKYNWENQIVRLINLYRDLA